MNEASGQSPKAALRRRVVIANRLGLHARAAARFVKLAGQFDAGVRVRKDDNEVSGLSILGLMMLAAVPGSALELIASGNQAQAALDALEALVEGKFDED
ncbi:MAG: HPr family phosphocarrier protein [Alphaproteobacteria bacterium]|nr:HPr family phosphocarrier protein [Alphaproteobacteria bacterium]MDP7604949.1 HPr family phosphocarrier protein [Alphaproteobacteria bacterium]HJP22420.1 HPr family phosphocarrier protein [Alphaproteobacteria bacterium]